MGVNTSTNMHAMIRLLMLASLLATLSLASTESANRIVPEVVELETEADAVVAESEATYEFVSTTESTTGSSSGSGVAPTPTPTPTAPVPTQEPTYSFDGSEESSTGSAAGSAAEPTAEPTAVCMDLMVNGSEWHDSYSTEYTCDWYSDDGNCQAYGDEYEYDGLTADEACCSCGGGTTGGTSDGSGEELLVANELAGFKPSPHLQMTSSSFDAK